MTPLGPVLEYDLFRGTWSLEGRLGRAEGSSSKSDKRSSFSEGIESLSSSGCWVRRDLSRKSSLYSSCAVVMIAKRCECVYEVVLRKRLCQSIVELLLLKRGPCRRRDNQGSSVE